MNDFRTPLSRARGLGSAKHGVSHWISERVGAVALVLFGGRGKVSELMGDFGKGINSFKKGLSEKDDPKVINAETKETDKTTV